MSEEDFETEAKKRGWVKNKGESSEATSKGEATSVGCFGDCFGSGRKKEATPLQTVYEESDQNFEFRPHTQLQYDETDNQRTGGNTPLTPLEVETPIRTATSTPMDTTPVDTPPTTPYQR